MKSSPSFFKHFGAIVLVLGLAGCATTTDSHPHKAHHPAGSMTSSAMPMDGMMGSGTMDMKSMCEMHSKMMADKTPAERKAMVDAHHGDMSAADRQRHMEMMQQRCR